jgi:hypothetical protein
MGWVVNAKPRPLYPREIPGTHCIGGWVGPMAGLYECGKSRPPPGFDPQSVLPIASRYTDLAIPAHTRELVRVISNFFVNRYSGTPKYRVIFDMKCL